MLPRAPRVADRHGANVITTIFGNKGSGKTTLLLWIVRRWIEAGGAAVLVDTAGTAAPTRPAWLTGKYLRATSIEGLRRQLGAIDGPALLRWLPGFDTDTDPAWRIIYDRGSVLLAIDECEEYANAYRVDVNLARLLSHGRHRSVSLASTVRLPHELHGRFRGLADRVVSFCQPSAHYARILAKDAFHDPDLAGSLQSLPAYTYLAKLNGRVAYGTVEPI